VRLKRVLVPSAVLALGYPPSGAGLGSWAKLIGESANDARAMANGIRRKARRRGDGPFDFLKCKVVIFFVFIFC